MVYRSADLMMQAGAELGKEIRHFA